MTTTIVARQEINNSFGFVRELVVEESDFPCHVHDVPMKANYLETFTGWIGQDICPAYSADSPCPFGPDGEVVDTEVPDTVAAERAEKTQAEAAEALGTLKGIMGRDRTEQPGF